MKILNLYAGIGGNRKLWGDEHTITAVEHNEKIADIYHDFFPKDKIIIGDAHEYLEKNYKDFDFIWSSPPCPSHSRVQIMRVLTDSKKYGCDKRTAMYPDMSLYQEIIFLKAFALKNCKWVIENVIPYYEPLIKGIILGRHLFWSNFHIEKNSFKNKEKNVNDVYSTDCRFGFSIKSYSRINHRKVLKNCVDPEIGKYILDQALMIPSFKQKFLFKGLNYE